MPNVWWGGRFACVDASHVAHVISIENIKDTNQSIGVPTKLAIIHVILLL